MNNEYLKKALTSLNFNDETSNAFLRYLLMQVLVCYVDEYKNILHTRTALQLLQSHRKLQTVYEDIKDKYRNNNIQETDFSRARLMALEYIINLSSSVETQVSAA